MRIIPSSQGLPRSIALFLCFFFFIVGSVFSQTLLRGKITGKDGATLSGATAVIKGTNNFSITDSLGHFTLKANPGELIEFSFLGYDPYQITLGNETELNISLTQATVILDEVVVIGYGTALRKDVTGSVASISQNDFLRGNITTSLEQVQGKIPGLVITQPGGDPNGDFNVRIRGASSLEGQPPLLVIDGVAIDDFNRAITTLNPTDIASYDILKDASAAAIFGSRGANGVILITTKKGTAGKVTIDYSGYGSAEIISNQFDVLSAKQWRDATATDPNASSYDSGGNTNWQKEITRTAYTQSHIFSASGGSDQLLVRGSVGYINQQGVVINTGKELLTARLNADIRNASKKLNINFGINTSVINRDLLPDQSSTAQVRQGGAGVFTWAQRYLPVWPVYNADGSYYFPVAALPNPVGLLKELHSKQKQNFFQTAVKGDYELVNGLKVGAVAALSNGNDGYNRVWPPIPGSGDDSYGGRANHNKQNFTGDLHFNFRKQIGEHQFNITGVYEYNKFINDGFYVYARGPIVEGLLLSNNLGSATDVTPNDISSYKNEVKIISFLGRLVYNYGDRYILTANFRRDGSSKFGTNNRWGNFPSASIAWRITNESFMNDARWLDVKLRASYGLTGNQENLPPYNYQTLYGPAGPYYLGSYGQSYGVVQEGNPDLKWEVRESLNFGVDFSLWHDRVSGVIDVYSDKTSDMLFLYNIPQPPFVTNQAYANAANATNKGIEISLGGDVINQNLFKWNARINFGAVRNRITNLLGQFKGFDLTVTNTHYGWASGGSFQGIYVTELKAGYPAGVFWLPEHAGFDGAGNELLVTHDTEGNVIGTSTTFTDQDRVYIDPTPDFEWGLTNTLTYRNFDLSIFFRGVQGSKIFANSLLNLGSRAYLPASNVTESALAYGFAQKPNISTFWLQDGSFTRLENVTVGYTLNHIKGITRLRIYAVGRNLFLLTNYEGIDPEVNVEGSQRNIDQSYYPKTRSFTIGLDISI